MLRVWAGNGDGDDDSDDGGGVPSLHVAMQ